MKTYKIKILQDTPFDKKDTILTLSDFRLKYSYVCSSNVTDMELITYLEDTNNVYPKGWFEVMQEVQNNFKVGEWVWHEELQQAFCVMPHNTRGWKPCHVTVEAANTYIEKFKRRASSDEIKLYDLKFFTAQEDILIGNYKCFFWHNSTWKEIRGVKELIYQYIKSSETLGKVSRLDFASNKDGEYLTSFTGLKVGCKVFSHDEIIEMARLLHII